MCDHGGTDNLLARLTGAVDALRAAARVPLGGAVSDVELTQAVQILEAVSRVAQSHKLTVVREISQRHAHRGQSAATTEDLLARALHVTPGEARGETELAAGLAVLPDTAAALADGRMGVAQAAVAVKKAAEVKDRDDADVLLATIDQTAATLGQTTNRVRLAREIDTAIARTGVDVLAERERRAFQRRGVWFGQRDGQPTMDTRMTVEGLAAVRAALDALGKLDGAGDTRTVAQRHHDALVTLATRYLDEGTLPSVASQRPHVLLVTTPDALHDTPGADPSLLDGHGPISANLARQICCDANITAVLTTNEGRVLDARPLRKDPTARQRAAVIARDKTCIGCGAPASRCEIHHIIWRRHHGRTQTDNLTLACWTCHHHIHHNGWHITRDHAGRYTAAPPPAEPPPAAPPAPPHIDAMKERDLRSPLTVRVSDARGCQSVDHREEEGPDDVTVCRNRSASSPVGDRAPGRQRRGARAGADRQ